MNGKARLATIRLDVDNRPAVEGLRAGGAHPQALDGEHGDAVPTPAAE